MLQQLDALLRFDLVHFDQILQANTYSNDRQFRVSTLAYSNIFIERIVKAIRK